VNDNSALIEEATALLGHHRLRFCERDGKQACIMGLCEKHQGYKNRVVIGVRVLPGQCFACWVEWEEKP